jgi:hypothetical protein
MVETTPQSLASLLAGQDLSRRTGILELPLTSLGLEGDFAVGLNVGHCDICSWKVDQVGAGRTRIGLRWDRIVSDLESLTADLSIPGYCIWISSVDVLLAGIPHSDRSRFWEFMRIAFRPPRGLLLSIPEKATHILSSEERELWFEYGRLSIWNFDERRGGIHGEQ